MKTVIKRKLLQHYKEILFLSPLKKAAHQSVSPSPSYFRRRAKNKRKNNFRSQVKKQTLSTSTEMTTEIRGIRRKRQTSGTNEKRRNINAETLKKSYSVFSI